jgi:membrane fusion protein (multidrug efflux system)
VLEAKVPREIDVAQKARDAAKAEQDRDDQTLEFTREDVKKAIHEATSDLDAAQARLVLAKTDHKRYADLFAREAATERDSQVATRTYHTTRAEVKAAEARLGRAEAARNKVKAVQQAAVAAAHQAQKAEQALKLTSTRLLDVEQAAKQVEVKRQQVREAQRSLDVAKTKLRYTQIVAPFPGVIVHLYRHLGDHVPAGTPVLSMYNPELTYVTANLEETKLEGVAPGNWVRLDVDAFSKPFHGRVVWINRATGANFALVPRNISSGEFTKVVQRVPVRILRRTGAGRSCGPGCR